MIRTNVKTAWRFLTSKQDWTLASPVHLTGTIYRMDPYGVGSKGTIVDENDVEVRYFSEPETFPTVPLYDLKPGDHFYYNGEEYIKARHHGVAYNLATNDTIALGGGKMVLHKTEKPELNEPLPTAQIGDLKVGDNFYYNGSEYFKMKGSEAFSLVTCSVRTPNCFATVSYKPKES